MLRSTIHTTSTKPATTSVCTSQHPVDSKPDFFRDYFLWLQKSLSFHENPGLHCQLHPLQLRRISLSCHCVHYLHWHCCYCILWAKKQIQTVTQDSELEQVRAITSILVKWRLSKKGIHSVVAPLVSMMHRYHSSLNSRAPRKHEMPLNSTRSCP